MNKPLIFTICCFLLIIVSSQTKGQSIQLNYPNNGFVNSKNYLELCWNYIPGSIYEIEVSNTADFSSIFYTANNLAVRKTVINNLNTNTTYYWRVRSTMPTLSPWSYANYFIQFTPTTIGSLSLWLKADSLVTLNGNNVLTWGDLSSNQYAVTQATSANQPTLIQNFCNNKAALKFDGNDAFEIPSFNYGQSNSVFLVCKKNAGASGGRYTGCYNNEMEIATDLALVSTNVLAYYVTTSPTVLSLRRSVTPSDFYINDSLAGSTVTSIPPLNSGGFYIGRSYSNSALGYLNGEIAEIIVASSQLSDSLNSLTNTYLMDKYSEVLTIGNDTIITDNFCPITLTPNNGFSNYLWSTGDTTPNLSTNVSGQYWLRARDYFGRIKYDTINIQFPGVNQLTSQSLCLGAQLTWNSGLNNTFTHHWQDNSSLNQFTIANQGQYYFTATDAYGCNFNSDTAFITIDNFAIENNLGNDTSLCAGNTIQLQNNNSNLLSYLWSNGSNNDSLVINNTGQYWVEISNENNCILRDTINISIVGTAPNALFSIGNGCLDAPLNFVDLSTPPVGQTISQWLWDFGDGSTSTTQNNIHVYDSIGTYTVSLKVIVSTGCGAVYSNILNVFNKPILNFTAFNLCNDNLTEFGNTSNLFGGSQQSILWNFGDNSSTNNTANTNQASHTYDTPGNYLIQLIVQTNEGCVDTLQNNITIKPSPVASFSTSNLCLGEQTLLTDNSVIDFPWQNLTRTWFLPYGDTSHLYQPAIIFDTTGIHQVTLFVQSTNGCSDSITKPVMIFNKPVAHLTVDQICLGAPALLKDTSICIDCQITNYSWYVNNLLIGNSENINYLFEDTGNFSIRLEVQNNAGCTATIDTTLQVNPLPLSSFSINSNFGSPPFEATFDNLSSNANTFNWEFGDGGFSTLLNPSHTYTDTGVYVITLNAYNSDLCVSASSISLNLKPKVIDLMLFNLETKLLNGYIESVATVFNKSSTIVTGLEMKISNQSNIVLKERYDNIILPGEFKVISLNSKIQQGEGFNLSEVLCVELSNINEGTDVDLSNNSRCNALSDDQFKLMNIFPNPTKDNMVINFISPANLELRYEIIDLTGNIIQNEIITAKTGYNQFNIETSGLAAGSYICKLLNNGSSQSLMFIKLNRE